ncbi:MULTISPECIES: hypothetical protein [unclassified Frankia]|uniref:hypothetical protein n=1 Tax=unclassified Frankia TaxID=2632575 RepID=UPI002AD450EA|nr:MULTISPECIES: hypothetical protein [unclassified Frankia]
MSLFGLPSFLWDSTQVASYEAALEAGHAVVGAYSARIADERKKADPDLLKIQQWRAGCLAVIAERDALNPSDPEAIRAARVRFSELAVQVREG